MVETTASQMRLDKWLWAARFFKTRALAQKHIELGRVLVNGDRVKNSKQVQVGDMLDLTLNSLPFKLTIQALNHQRRPAPEARLLYQEDQATLQRREELSALNQAAHHSQAHTDGRPTKKNRRDIEKLKKNWA
ncbi:RNA-binding S4 domain-containing protein [Neisseria sp. Ec49-e6-T10]|uniref:RNA-binding S4 domain-containing protein n=1 Tax=Neisseria sp. Ec49-e6-T10 TaxID=3140744 RepID=UPI003EB7287C